MEEAEEEGDLVGGPAVSINPRVLSNTGPPNRKHTPNTHTHKEVLAPI